METDRFKGVNKAVTPHRLSPGEVSDLRNLRSDLGKFRKRPGQSRVKEFDGTGENLLWPAIIMGALPGGDRQPIIPVDDGSGGTGGGTTPGILYPSKFPVWTDT